MAYQGFPKDRQQDTRRKGRSACEVAPPSPAILRQICVIAAAILLLAPVLYAQTSTVFGTITYHNHQPAVNVYVSIGGVYRYTDGGGRYKIEGVPQGQQHMTIKSGQTVLWQGDVNISGAIVEVSRELP